MEGAALLVGVARTVRFQKRAAQCTGTRAFPRVRVHHSAKYPHQCRAVVPTKGGAELTIPTHRRKMNI